MRILACTILLVLLASGVASAAQSYVVRPGDTLWSIASRFGVTVEAIARANNLSDVDLLQIGQRLVIPPVSGRPRPAAERFEAHEVQPGDTLWALARRYGMRVDDLAALNAIAVESTLRIGQVLKVRARAEVTTGSRAAPAVRPSAIRSSGPLPYRGEQWASSLIGLARRFIGTRYRWGATGPGAFDCSGFLQYVYARMGVALPRTTFAMFHGGRPVPPGEVLPGDMVFFTTYRRGPSHAGIYLGDGLFIHSSSGYGSVTITPLSKEYYRKRYLGARRF